MKVRCPPVCYRADDANRRRRIAWVFGTHIQGQCQSRAIMLGPWGWTLGDYPVPVVSLISAAALHIWGLLENRSKMSQIHIASKWAEHRDYSRHVIEKRDNSDALLVPVHFTPVPNVTRSGQRTWQKLGMRARHTFWGGADRSSIVADLFVRGSLCS